jgi:UDP-glucose 4-epimerase
MRIMVTGGAGFIGSHIADAYVAAGHRVMALDSLWDYGGGLRSNLPQNVELVHMDIRDPAVERVVREFKPEVVNHHAAQHSVAIGSRDPHLDAEVNVVGLINILDVCVRTDVRKFVFASSGATYGEPTALPITEGTPQQPTSPYGITKMAAEHYLRFYQRERGLDFTALRYGNVYGPRQDPNGEAGVISIFIGKFLQREPVRIDWDGKQTRDYVFVKDVAEVNLRALERGSGGCYVIGTNARTSVEQIYRSLVEIAGFEPPIVRGPKRPGDVRDAQFDPSLAKSELGWAPKTVLLDGMRQTFEYFRSLTPAPTL